MTANFSNSDPQDAVDFNYAVRRATALVAYFNRVGVKEPLGDHSGLYIIAQAVLGMKKELDDLASRLETAQSEEMAMAAEVDAATAELEDTVFDMQERLNKSKKDSKHLVERNDIYFNSQWEAWKQVTALCTAIETYLRRVNLGYGWLEEMGGLRTALSANPPAVPDTTKEE